jgi:O-antigen/teichoic acid export membrane protein
MKHTDKHLNNLHPKIHGTDGAKNLHQPAFAIDSLINYSTQMAIFILSFISSIIIARMLGPEGKGIYSFVFIVPIITKTIINLGMNSSNVYFIGKRRFPINRIVGNAFFYSIFSGTGAAALLIILVPFADEYFMHGTSNIFLYITIPTIPILLLIENIYYFLLANRDMVELSSFRLVQPIIYIFALLFILLNHASLSVVEAIVANISGILAAVLLGSYFIIKKKYFTGLVLDGNIFKETITFGLKQHLGTVSQLLNYRVDMFIIAALLTPADLGLYTISVLIAETIWYLPTSIGQVLFAKIASVDEKVDDDFTPLVCRSVVFSTLVSCIFLFIVSDFLIPLFFTSMFLSSVMALKLLLPGIFFFSISKILAVDLTGRGFPQYFSFASAVALCATIVFDLLLIPRLGINGASLGSSISYFLGTIIIMYQFKKKSKVMLRDLLIIKLDDLSEYRRLVRYFIGRLKGEGYAG